MPVHLPPISRRAFIQRSLVAGAGLTFAPDLFAARRRSDANSWALMADTHIAADTAKMARGVNMADHLRAVSAELLALPKHPAGAFVIGDCAFNSGEQEDYAAFTKLLEPMRAGGLPLHLTLGNHDERRHFAAMLGGHGAKKGPLETKRVAMLPSREVNWFVLDSLETTLQTPGSLGSAQLKWLANTLDSNAEKPALVLVHHNPGETEQVSGLKDTAALLEVVRPRRQVKAWIYGHTHKWEVRADDSGIHLVNLPPVAYVFQEGNPAGWVHATVRPDGMNLELRCIDTTHKDQGQVVVLNWRA